MLIPKPPICQACPLYGDGRGFVPDRFVDGATVLVLAQNPGSYEERGERVLEYVVKKHPVTEPTFSQPLIGPAGHQLDTQYLPLTGLDRSKVSTANVLKCRWERDGGRKTNDLPPAKVLKDAVRHCTTQHLRIPDTISHVIAMGGEAFDFTQGEHRPITEWRGFVGPQSYNGASVFATEHLANVLRHPALAVTMRVDYRRIGKWLNGSWPSPIPERVVLSNNAELPLMRKLFAQAERSPLVAIDTEYTIEKKLLRIVGLGWKLPSGSVTGMQLDWLKSPVDSAFRATFVRLFKQLVTRVPMVFQNFKGAELPVLQENFGITYEDYRHVDDVMLGHSVLYSELPHTLEYLASTIGKYPKLKHLDGVDDLLYNWGDVIETLACWEVVWESLCRDQGARHVYTDQLLPLIPIIAQREARGIRIDQEAVRRGIQVQEHAVEQASWLCSEYIEYPVNLGSPKQVMTALKKTGLPRITSIAEDKLVILRGKFLPVDTDYERQQIPTTVYTLDRISHGAHPVLEWRAAYAKNQQILSHFLRPLADKPRCYPTESLHTQATGRHSITNPPIATFPTDVLAFLLPDPGTCWIGGDYDQQELRLFAALVGDQLFLEALEQGWDIHTLNVCDAFGYGYPPDKRSPHHAESCRDWRDLWKWGGKEDPRRVWAKRYLYRTIYGGDPSTAASIPGTASLGISKREVNRAALRFYNRHPSIHTYHRQVQNMQKKAAVVSSWDGRPRRTVKRGEEAVRAMGNHPMQAGGAGILNFAILEVCKAFPEATYVYSRHDSLWMEFPIAQPDHVLVQRVRGILETPRMIAGRLTPFPMTMKWVDASGVERCLES